MRITEIAVVAVLAAALCACASPREQLVDAAASGVSAVRSSALALELDDDHRAWQPASDTVLSDALAELGDAHRSLVELVPGDPDEQHARDRLADEVQHALSTVAAARATLARGDDLAPWITRLEKAADALATAAR